MAGAHEARAWAGRTATPNVAGSGGSTRRRGVQGYSLRCYNLGADGGKLPKHMVDVTFDCHRDSGGRDPDSNSPTLRRSHQALWSKRLPCGKVFHLDISGPKPFLTHRSELGEFHLSSDSITHRYANRPTIKPFIDQLPATQRNYVVSSEWLVGECIVFPGTKVDGKVTINGARGMNRKIGDRFDLTLECIRRHYRRERSPLSDVLERYADFFGLFEDFASYVDFFLLQDLVEAGTERIRFYLPHDDFTRDPLPPDFQSYLTYIDAVMAFASGRARRILQWCANPDAG